MQIFIITLILLCIIPSSVAIQPLPLCTTCQTDDGFSCVFCATCDPYATVTASGLCQCDSGYYFNEQNQNDIHCDRCHTSCLTCNGPRSSDCLTCPDRFTYVQQGSKCVAPDNSTDEVLVDGVYSFYGASLLSNWAFTNSPGSHVTHCNTRTLIGGQGLISGSNTIYLQYNTVDIPPHYELRIKVAFYIFNSGGSTSSSTIRVFTSGATDITRQYSGQTVSRDNCGTDYIHFNVDDSFPHQSTTVNIYLGITNTGQHFGIREFYLIAKKCQTTNCTKCTGYQADECTQCTDPNRVSNDTTNGGTCKCTGNYYQEPYAGECVDPCPSVPVKYYGDPTTRFCVLQCPNGYYALDDTYRCVTDCPTTSAISGKHFFRDQTNKKCVTTCPSTEPYGSLDHRYCYAVDDCPASYYMSDAQDRRCVSTCPNNSTYKLWAHQTKCVATCPEDYFANPATISCVLNCSSSSYPFKDNSTGVGVCVNRCPAPNFFGETTQYYCVEQCQDPQFGERYDASNNLIQLCVNRCNSPRWGLINENRKCVEWCPQGFWGEPGDRVCTNVSTDCGSLYADNYTRKCVSALSCSHGFYGENDTRQCVADCPDGSYAEDDTQMCQQQCDPPYFRDSGINKCVDTCFTQGTYADVSSTRSCVTACNTTGSTPWADDSTRTCVSDCNNTISSYVADNTTWKCVYHCPVDYYADLDTTAPKCVQTCPSGFYADNSTGTGLCVAVCPKYPALFGDATGGMNECVAVCSVNTFGDETGNRQCKSSCTGVYFAQDDATRLCVKKCKDGTYGWNNQCLTDPNDCPNNYFADDYTNLCVNPCPISQGTFGDPETKRCVRQCPDNPNYGTTGAQTYYADPSNRQCVLTCDASYSTGLFGNNDTRTCQTKCLDYESYAEDQTLNRICVARCLQIPVFRYANNDTKVCGTSLQCQDNYYGRNDTQTCVEYCPANSYAYKTATDKLCIDQCPKQTVKDWFADTTTGKNICVEQCPLLPLRFADPTTKTCVAVCPNGYFGQLTDRTCVQLCPDGEFAHEDSLRRCVDVCPDGYFGDDDDSTRYCHASSDLCGSRFGDPYLNLCVGVCSGPSPVNLFGSGDDCVDFCPLGTYADSQTGTRLCVTDCPDRTSLGGSDLYGDPTTHTCQPQCITPLTWADSQTRDCVTECTALPIPMYSENFDWTCVTALNCPTTPSMTFGDNSTRDCLSNCTNDEFGDPTSRTCLTQCPDDGDQSGAVTENYYGDKSTGINLCIAICPQTPRKFGRNDTNLCVDQCPANTYGDQTGKRTCVPQCPIIPDPITTNPINTYAQNTSRICVTKCQDGTWGVEQTRECVETPAECATVPSSAQWADSSTNMCVDVCPEISGLFANPLTKQCVELCPDDYFADTKTRICVLTCPSDHGPRGTFGNNSTRICQEHCQQGYADVQHPNRLCVEECSQSPSESFADPSSKRCVDRCPVHPDLYGETNTFTCVEKCLESNEYSDTHTRRCETSCPANQYKLNSTQLCVSECPSNPDLYADSNSGYCESTCTNGWHRYPTERKCVSNCKNDAGGLFMYDDTCVKFCPYEYYADSNGICIKPCTSGTYGQNTTTTCESTCTTGFAQGTLCVAKCNDGTYGENKVCQSSCTAPLRASNDTNLCVSDCVDGTYLQNGVCESTCSIANTYADPNTKECTSSCTGGLYGDGVNNLCVSVCPDGYYRDATGYCLNDCTVNNRKKDRITGNCETTCSNGLWGHEGECIDQCPTDYYGYESDRDCYNISSRPSSAVLADDNSQTWVGLNDCPLSPMTYGDLTKKQCVTDCIDGEFADPQTRQCATGCSNTSYFGDGTIEKCVLICPQNYFANTDNNLCEDTCTGGKYAYSPTHQCVGTCPAPYWFGYTDSNTNVRTCVQQCPSGTFSEGRTCETSCSDPLFADSTTHACVEVCIDGFYGDEDSNTCVTDCGTVGQTADPSTNLCVEMNSCPSEPDLYEQDNVCVEHCSSGLFADPTVGVRQCKTGCPEGLYAEPESRRCLSACKPGYFGRNSTNTCNPSCEDGEYADQSTGFCESTCPSPTFADPLTDKCEYVCTGSQLGEGRVCVDKCSSPNYGDPLKKTCELSCPEFDYLFAENSTRMCVKQCQIVANSYADKHVRMCVENCTQLLEYMVVATGQCVTKCPQGLFMDNSTKMCQSQCDDGFAENSSRFCVERCFGAPTTYAHTTVGGVKTCKYKCLTDTETLFADDRTNECVSQCASPLYSDPLSGNCVDFCPQGYYAEDTDRTCSLTCNSSQYADNYTRKCVDQCPMGTEETFANTNNQKCVRICPTGEYANPNTKTCVVPLDCPDDWFADDVTRYCVSRCPTQPLSFGHIPSQKCISQCPSSQDLYGDFDSQICVSACPQISSIQTYQDPLTRTCVYTCSIQDNYYADTTDDRCKEVCSGSQLRDNSTQKCVTTCPSNPLTYADTQSKYCVRTCPNGKFASDETDRICIDDCQTYSLTFGDSLTNRCTDDCPIGYFNDNSTYLCVQQCPQSEDYYADSHSGHCVANCPKGTGGETWVTYADSVSDTCVTKCPDGWFAVNSTQRCVEKCPLNQYADLVIRVCVQFCTVRPGLYKQTDSRVCVEQCPQTPVMSHKYDVNHSCVYTSAGVSGCPGSYYANPLNKMCTTLCPQGYFAQDSTKTCVQECQVNFVADPIDRKCKGSCSSVPEYFADDVNKVCVQHCPEPYFANNITHRCTLDCQLSGPIMFRYEPTRQCVEDCHYPYFAYSPNRTCLLECPDSYYAQDSTRSCETTCLAPLFADDSTNQCVSVCPQDPDYYGLGRVCVSQCTGSTYADYSTRMCVGQNSCPVQPLLFADPSTNICVQKCPADENLFADNDTRMCLDNCTEGFFAQVQSRTCMQDCPDQLDTYADPLTWVCQPTCTGAYFAEDFTKTCTLLCPDEPSKTYAYNFKCLDTCPTNFYGENNTRTCRSDCKNYPDIFADPTTHLCVTTCPIGLFAENDTQTCVQTCPDNSFADNSTRICVAECPGTQRLFADPTTWRCVLQCPQGRFGDTNEWECLDSCPDTASGYRFDVGRLCVEQCPSPYFAFTSTRTCVVNCGAGLYGDAVTRTCQSCPTQCPTCLSLTQCLSCETGKYLSFGSCVDQCILNSVVATYANPITFTCVIATKCPTNYYGNNGTKSCIQTCDSQMYANTTTKTCENCPNLCTVCVNSTFCSACSSDAIFSTKDNFCYGHCNSTHIYYYSSNECVDACPQGSYLDFTEINCEKCNEICLTCEGNALNCTQCYESFKFNNTCLSQCPENYYAENGTCQVCTDTVESCTTPLKFSVAETTENFKKVLVLKFNQKTTVKANPKQFIKVRLSMNRRLLQSDASMINDGVQFTAEVLPDGTIKLILEPGTSLSNANFEVVITDPSQISTSSGQTLQQLEESISILSAEVFTSDQVEEVSYEVAALILSILLLIPVFFLLVCSPLPIFFAIETFQLISLFAYAEQLPPNLFYFLKQMRITRLTFLPNIFASVYSQPETFSQNIPPAVVQTQGQLSFAANAGGFMFLVFIYLFIGLIIWLGASKYNSNRPFRNVFEQIWKTRAQYGLVHDLLWLCGLNGLVGAFMQYYYVENASDASLGTIFMLAFVGGMVFMGYQIKKYNQSEDLQEKDQLKSHMSFYTQGVKEGAIYRHTTSILYLRKVLFAICLCAFAHSTKAQMASLLSLTIILFILLIVVRPFHDTTRNILYILNEFGLGFLCSAILYYLTLKQTNQPIGSKLTCGQIISIVLIFHLCVSLVYAYFRMYFYLKDLKKQWKRTEWYQLQFSEEYDNQLEKEIRELAEQDDNGNDKGDQKNNVIDEIESVEVTEIDGEDNDDQIIRLKIKRKKIKNSFVNVNNSQKPGDSAKLGGGGNTLKDKIPMKRNNKAEYIPISQSNQLVGASVGESNKKTENYERVIFDNDDNNQDLQNFNDQSPKITAQDSLKQNDWVEMKMNTDNAIPLINKDKNKPQQYEVKSKQALQEEGYVSNLASEDLFERELIDNASDVEPPVFKQEEKESIEEPKKDQYSKKDEANEQKSQQRTPQNKAKINENPKPEDQEKHSPSKSPNVEDDFQMLDMDQIEEENNLALDKEKEVQSIPRPKSHQRVTKDEQNAPKSNNIWSDDLDDILGEEFNPDQKKQEEKKKIRMMIFSDEQQEDGN